MDNLTPEEQDITKLAQTHYAERGQALRIDYILSYCIGEQPNCLYMVMGAVPLHCENCRDQHAQEESLLLLRVGDSFVPLTEGDLKVQSGKIGMSLQLWLS